MICFLPPMGGGISACSVRCVGSLQRQKLISSVKKMEEVRMCKNVFEMLCLSLCVRAQKCGLRMHKFNILALFMLLFKDSICKVCTCCVLKWICVI